jgi:hypothetical protein
VCFAQTSTDAEGDLFVLFAEFFSFLKKIDVCLAIGMGGA